jgi:DNA invertase Pin-like site-specific DNA recombinase
MAIYGYCRISTPKQSIDRQIRNILREYPDAILYQEVYTGTKVEGRKQWHKLMGRVVAGDTIVFDSVSRMSRNAALGFEQYQELYNRDISLVFLKEPHINTDTYKSALSNHITMTGTAADIILEAINRYLMELAKEQIRLSFQQSEKEVTDMRQRTKEGIQTARLKGKTIGHPNGSKYQTKKAAQAKEDIKKLSRDFGGTMKDVDCIRLIGISSNTYYKYKRELVAELNSEENGDGTYNGE